MTASVDHFHALYASHADPWHTDDSWYEQRKRAILLAALPMRRFASAYEPGCGNGALTLALARRCDRLIASDFCDEAVRLTLARFTDGAHVNVRKEILPEQWPAPDKHPAFDLIVLSELCYYFEASQLTTLSALAIDSLQDGGYLTACHWKKPFDDRQQDTADMHSLFARHPELQAFAHYEDDDFRLDLWQKTARVAAS